MPGDAVFYGCTLLFLFVSTLIAGFVCFQLCRFPHLNSFYTRVFAYSLSGTVILVLLYSLLKSRGLTVHLLFFVFFLFAFRDWSRANSLPPWQLFLGSTLRKSLILGLSIVFPFCYFLFLLWKPGVGWNGVNYDNVLYAKLSLALAAGGPENKWWMYFSDASQVTGWEPYHYFECWLNALCYSIAGTNSLLGLYLVVYPLFLCLSLLGLMAVFEHFKMPLLTEFLLAICLLFVGPVLQLKVLSYGTNRMACELPWQTYGEKFASYYPFVIAAFLFLLKGNKTWFYMSLLVLGIVSATVLPALLLFFAFVIFLEKDLRSVLFGRLMIVLLVLGVFYFIGATKGGRFFDEIKASGDFATGHLSFSRLKLSLSNAAYALVINLRDFGWSYFWIVPFLWLTRKTTEFPRGGVRMSLLFVCSGLLVSGVFFRNADSHQFFSNTQPVLNVAMIVLMVALFAKAPRRRIVFAGISAFAVGMCISNFFFVWREHRQEQKEVTVSDAYMSQISLAVDSGPGKRQVGLLCTTEDYVQYFVGRTHNSLYHLAFLNLDPLPLLLSSTDMAPLPDSLLWTRVYPKIRQGDAFYRFAHKHLREQNGDSLKLAFIAQKQLPYLILTPHYTMPDALASLADQIYVDEATHLRFVRLKNPVRPN